MTNYVSVERYFHLFFNKTNVSKQKGFTWSWFCFQNYASTLRYLCRMLSMSCFHR